MAPAKSPSKENSSANRSEPPVSEFTLMAVSQDPADLTSLNPKITATKTPCNAACTYCPIHTSLSPSKALECTCCPIHSEIMDKQATESKVEGGSSEGKPALPEFVMIGVPSEFPNFSHPPATRWVKFRKVDVSLFIFKTDAPEIVVLKHRLIKMATEEIQVLKHPDDHGDGIAEVKGDFRIEFEGILACLDLEWKDWEHEYLHPTPHNTFPNELIQKIVRLQHDVKDLQAKDKDLEERIEKMNKYSDEVHKKGRALSREVRELISNTKVRNFQQNLASKAEAEKKLREQMRAEKEVKEKQAKADKKARAEKEKGEKEEEPGMRWEGGDISLFDFGFGKK